MYVYKYTGVFGLFWKPKLVNDFMLIETPFHWPWWRHGMATDTGSLCGKSDGFYSQRDNDAVIWLSLYCKSDETLEQTFEQPVTWGDKMWRHSNDKPIILQKLMIHWYDHHLWNIRNKTWNKNKLDDVVFHVAHIIAHFTIRKLTKRWDTDHLQNVMKYTWDLTVYRASNELSTAVWYPHCAPSNILLQTECLLSLRCVSDIHREEIRMEW